MLTSVHVRFAPSHASTKKEKPLDSRQVYVSIMCLGEGGDAQSQQVLSLDFGNGVVREVPLSQVQVLDLSRAEKSPEPSISLQAAGYTITIGERAELDRGGIVNFGKQLARYIPEDKVVTKPRRRAIGTSGSSSAGPGYTPQNTLNASRGSMSGGRSYKREHSSQGTLSNPRPVKAFKRDEQSSAILSRWRSIGAGVQGVKPAQVYGNAVSGRANGRGSALLQAARQQSEGPGQQSSGTGSAAYMQAVRPSTSFGRPISQITRKRSTMQPGQLAPYLVRGGDSHTMFGSAGSSVISRERRDIQAAKEASLLIPGARRQVGVGGGFRNIGNTCYISAVLQSLIALDSFKHDVLDERLAATPAKGREVYHAFLDVTRQSEKKVVAIDPSSLKRALAQNVGTFGGNIQQDAHEFLWDFLNTLKDETQVGEAGGDGSTGGENAAAGVAVSSTKEGGDHVQGAAALESPPQNPTSLNFDCEVEHTLTCLSCGDVATSRELYRDFSLEVTEPEEGSDTPTIDHLLRSFFRSEQVERGCEECEGKQAELSHKLVRLPRVLVLHLKRFRLDFETQTTSKIAARVRIPETVDLRKVAVHHAEPPTPMPRRSLPSSVDAEARRQLTFSSPAQTGKPTTPVVTDLASPSNPSPFLSKSQSKASSQTTSQSRDSDIARALEESLAEEQRRQKALDEADAELQAALLASTRQGQSQGSVNDSTATPAAPTTQTAASSGQAQVVVISDSEDEFPDFRQHTPARPPSTACTSTTDVRTGKASGKSGSKARDPDDELQRALQLSKQDTQGSQLDAAQAFEDDLARAIAESKALAQGGGVPAGVSTWNADDDNDDTPAPADVGGDVGASPAYSNPDTPDTKYRYHLRSIISHTGSAPDCGHYVTDVYDPKKQRWRHYDDSVVKDIDRKRVLGRQRQSHGYLLFYVHESL